MAKHRAEIHEEHADETWLIPYADLLTLLLAMFIALYASSTVDQEKFNAMADAFYEQTMEGGGLTYIPYMVDPSDPTTPPDEGEAVLEEEQAMEIIQQQLQQYFQQRGIQEHVATTIDDSGLVISMNDAVLFDPGQVEIKPEYYDILVHVGETIEPLDNYIRVEGHTDTVPTGSEIYPTNWELSAARAASVVRLFQDASHVLPKRLSSAGYGEYRPIGDNATTEGRNQNRRVDIVILSSRYNVLEEVTNDQP